MPLYSIFSQFFGRKTRQPVEKVPAPIDDTESICVAVNIVPFSSPNEYEYSYEDVSSSPTLCMRNNPINDSWSSVDETQSIASNKTSTSRTRIKKNRNRQEILLPAIFQCPHCQDYLEICELRDCVFRHGYYRDTMQQIPSHSSRELCKALVKNGAIYGCGKPFVIYTLGNRYVIEACDYI